jgi:hypothetical protein
LGPPVPPGLTANFKAYATTIDALRANGVTVFASWGSRLSMTAHACIHDAVTVGVVYSRSSDALLSLLKSTGVPIVDPRNGLTTPRIDLAAALGVVLGSAGTAAAVRSRSDTQPRGAEHRYRLSDGADRDDARLGLG